MTDGTKRVIAGTVATVGAGYVVKKARPTIEANLPPLAAAVAVAALAAFVAGLITPSVTRFLDSLST